MTQRLLSVRSSTTFAAMAIAATLSLPAAQGDIQLTNLQWEFYQGGYVQADVENFQVFQDHYGNSPEQNTVSHTLGGASFLSSASMSISLTQSNDVLELWAINTLFTNASVEPGWPQGIAHAFAGLSLFQARFEITDHTYIYTGSEVLEDLHGETYSSGSVLLPGVYEFLLVDPFPPLTQTAFVGEGEADMAQSMREFLFHFQIPTPAGLWLAAVTLLPRRRRV